MAEKLRWGLNKAKNSEKDKLVEVEDEVSMNKDVEKPIVKEYQ